MRIIFSALLVLLGCFSASPVTACDLLDYKHEKVSKRVHLFYGPEGTTGIVIGNIVAVVGNDAILLVDGGQFHAGTLKALDQLKQITNTPVKYLVNTHWHGDHLLGNSAVKERFPEVQILAHSHTIQEAGKRYTDYVAQQEKEFPGAVEYFTKLRSETKDEDKKEWIDKTLDCANQVWPEMKKTVFTPPQLAVDSEEKIDLGGVTAIVKHLGEGNTPGDLVVYVPEEKVVATGDLVVHPSPYAIGSNLAPWPATLERLMGLGATTYVPGHGPAMRDTTYIRDVKALLESTRAQLEKMLADKVERAEAVKRLDARAFRAKYITTGMRREAFDQFFVRSAVAKMWPKPEAPKAEAGR
jgi:glyoxylase-like metal-dependent hydrolase (beta-lactamase superfamily II)